MKIHTIASNIQPASNEICLYNRLISELSKNILISSYSFSDWKYVILNRKFPSSNPKRTNSIPKILVSMGGTDIKGFTLLAIKSLIEIEESFFTTVLLGPGFSDHQKLNTLLQQQS